MSHDIKLFNETLRKENWLQMSFHVDVKEVCKVYKIMYLHEMTAWFKLKFLATTETVPKHYRETRSYETSQPENTKTITQAIGIQRKRHLWCASKWAIALEQIFSKTFFKTMRGNVLSKTPCLIKTFKTKHFIIWF